MTCIPGTAISPGQSWVWLGGRSLGQSPGKIQRTSVRGGQALQSLGKSPAGPGAGTVDTREGTASKSVPCQRAPPFSPRAGTTPLGPRVRDKERLPSLVAPRPHTPARPRRRRTRRQDIWVLGAAGSP